MKLKRIQEIANDEAEKSSHHYKLGAVIFRQGKVIAKGYNKTNRGWQKDYGHWQGSLHAEIAAMLRARTRLRGASLFVTRRNGLMARPCDACMAAIKEAGIRKVYYTDALQVHLEVLDKNL